MALVQDALKSGLSRRKFLAGSVAAVGAASLGLSAVSGSADNNLRMALADEMKADEEGEWHSAACWHNCGGKCLVRVCTKDGVIVRQGTDDINTDDEINRQQRACLRGWSQQYQARGLDRLKYPMKRKNWSPEDPHAELRGIDEWERISWDEAAQYIHDEVERINGEFGDNSILALGGGMTGLLNKLNINYLSSWTTSSWGSWYAPGVLGWGDGCNDYAVNNDRLDMLNCDYVVAFGYNPAWAALGNATNFAKSWKDAGVKFIIFDPIYTDTTSILDAQWVPIRPATDMAAMMAMAYVMLEEDSESSPLIDWDFLDRCCVGQDADHMPADATTDENFFDYLRGEYDGVPKTPEWASEICGVDPETLREVARILGKDNNVAILSSWASARTYNTEQLPQTAICLGAMGGHIGKSGNCVGPTAWNHTNNFGPRLVKAGSAGSAGGTSGTGSSTSVSDTQMWGAVLGEPFNPTTLWKTLNGYGVSWKDVIGEYDLTKRIDNITADVRMIWTANSAKLTTCEGAKKGIEAFRSVEFVVGQGHFLTASNKYADIVLPITTNWEREGSFVWDGYINRDTMLINRKVVDPYFEALSDTEACIKIGEKFGLTQDDFFTVSETQRLFNAVATCSVVKENGVDWENLCSITQEDIDEWGVEGEPQEGRIPIAKFMEDGVYRVDRHVGDNYGYIDKQAFREDPEANPIATNSGKVEFYCQTWADCLNSNGYSDEPYSPIPKYRACAQGFEETFVDGDIAGEKTEFPLQCINPHYQRRSHSIFDNIPWLREACANPFFMSKKDADERGIVDGDTVKISSKYGETLRPAYVTARMMPGVVGLPHGAWVRVDENDAVDHGGSENYITGNVATGMGVDGYNTLNVQVEKWDGDPLPADKDVPQTILFD